MTLAGAEKDKSAFITATQIVASILSLAGLVYVFGAIVLSGPSLSIRSAVR